MIDFENFGQRHYGKIGLLGLLVAIAALLAATGSTIGLFFASVSKTFGNGVAILSADYFFESTWIIVFWIAAPFAFAMCSVCIFAKKEHFTKTITVFGFVFAIFFAWMFLSNVSARTTAIWFRKHLAIIEAFDQPEALKLRAEFLQVKTYSELILVRETIENLTQDYQTHKDKERTQQDGNEAVDPNNLDVKR